MKIISRHRLFSLCVIALCAVRTRAGLVSGNPHGASDQIQGAVQAAAPVQPPRFEFPLWEGDSPGALGKEAKDIPTLTPYFAPPAKATGAALIICPGGSYVSLSPHEGVHYALWLNEQGITGFVLKYRLGSGGYKHPAMMQDVLRAIRYVRANAGKWRLDANRIGVMGSSAGGHLAATALTHFDAGNPRAADPIDRVSSRPSLGVLCYPVITMGADTHSGSKRNLLGDNPDPSLVEFLSNEKQVTKDTPPTFIFHTFEDTTVFGGIKKKGEHHIRRGRNRNRDRSRCRSRNRNRFYGSAKADSDCDPDSDPDDRHTKRTRPPSGSSFFDQMSIYL